MRPEDINRYIEKALRDIKAENAEQQERFDRLRDKVRESGDAAAKAIREIERLSPPESPPEHQAVMRLVRERGHIGDAIMRDLTTAFEEHAGLIDRIGRSFGD